MGWIWNIGKVIELIATYKTSSFLALSYVLGYIILLDKKRKAMNAVGVYFADNYFRRIVNQVGSLHRMHLDAMWVRV